MPSAQQITLYDGQATPVAHVFNPRGQVGPSLTTLVNDESTTSAGSMKFALGFSGPSNERKTNRVRITFSMPHEATDADGVTRVAYTGRFNADVIIPEEMTSAERADLAAFCSNAVAHTITQGYVADLDPMY
jgi:hypothetical protein